MEEGSPLPLPHLCPALPHPMWTLSHSDFIPATAGGHNKPFHVSGQDVLCLLQHLSTEMEVVCCGLRTDLFYGSC